MARIPLPMLAKKLADDEDVWVGYRRIYNAALDGRLPTAVRQTKGWDVDDEAVPRIAELFRPRGAAAA
jgi:hypothetical protein